MLFFSAQVTAGDIRDIKGPILYPSSFKILFMFLAAFFSAGLLYLLYKFIKAKIDKRKAPLLLPHELALKRLKELMQQDLIKKGLTKEFYTELSDIIRRYLEDRFSLKAPEMTTEEFLNSLRSTDLLSAEHKGLLKNFLTHCDLVKFAMYSANEREIEQSFLSAEMLVEQTKDENKT